VALRRLKRKRKRGRSVRVSAVRKAHHHIVKDFTAPECFSLVENAEETLLFFNDVFDRLRHEYSVNLNLENVRKITPDAILYMLSLLEMFKTKRGICISGNAPKDKLCGHIFTESGFYNYVKSDYTPRKDQTYILEVRSADKVVGKLAHEVVLFVHEKIKDKIPVLVRRKVYTTILECMGNTREHAYTGHEEYHTKWWLMALFDEQSCSVTFAILDNGQGIPKTVRKKIFERLWPSDNKLIQSALKGDFRTRTNEQWRGKGLPKIQKTLDEGIIRNLVVLSNHGYVNYGTDLFGDLEQKFYGTLVSWTIA